MAWAAAIFLVVRALVTVWRKDRNLATASSLAVAAAFVGGAFAPFSLWMLPAPAPAPVAVAPVAPAVPAGAVPVAAAIACPPGATVVAGSAVGHIDTATVDGTSRVVADVGSVKSDQRVELTGWIVAAGGTLAKNVCVVDGHHTIAMQGKYGIDRPDVAAALAKPDDRGAGVDVTFTLPRGPHTIELGVVEADGKTVHLLDQPLRIVSQ